MVGGPFDLQTDHLLEGLFAAHVENRRCAKKPLRCKVFLNCSSIKIDCIDEEDVSF